MEKKNILEVTQSELCMGCGICQDACPHGCINIQHNNTNQPQLNESTCVNCGLCYASCPGKGVGLKSCAEQMYPDGKQDQYIGRYEATYTGYSNDKEIRYHSASGGLITQFLIYLFNKKLIDGAVVVGQQNDNKLMPKPFIARNKQEVITARSSKYVVTSMEGMAKEIIATPGRYVIVGLPCHIQAFRQLEGINKRLRESIIGHFAIYCSLNKTRLSTDYYFYRYKVDRNKVAGFAYRDDGYMGYMKFTGSNQEIIKKVPYVHFWMGSHNFFQNPRCSMCFDQFGELSDISFGDINIPPYNEDKVGINSCIVRDSKWHEMLKNAATEGYIALESLTLDDLIKSQNYVVSYKKGRGIAACLSFRRIMKKRIPVNDELLPKPGIKDYLKVLANSIMMYLGEKRIYWPLIKSLDPYKD